jgi:hypothetical protein
MMETTTAIHCFEEAGLGKAPFRYVGIVDQQISHGDRVIGQVGGIAVTTKPGGSCMYCSRAILYMFNVESADGKTFHVGSECILKTGDKGLIVRVQSALRDLEKKRRLDKKRRAADADKQLCETAQIGLLASKPHPHPYRASQGETLYDWAKWMLEMKNYSTLARVIRAELP